MQAVTQDILCGSRILHVFNCEVKLKKESFEAMLLLQKREKLSRLCFVIGNTQIIKFLFKLPHLWKKCRGLNVYLVRKQKLFLLFPVWR